MKIFILVCTYRVTSREWYTDLIELAIMFSKIF